RLDHWVMFLTEFDLKFIPQKAIKGQVIVDQLVVAPLVDASPISDAFCDDFTSYTIESCTYGLCTSMALIAALV
ncbi:hypothetical protein KI387_033124, partial [Taxus chinensis]